MDRCLHGDVTWMENNMVTNYLGAHRQALLDMSDWVERGIEPPQTTVYEYRDGQIYPAASAKERKGVQPVVELLANGSACAHVKVGEAVQFTARAVVPEGAGQITAIDFGFADNRALPGGMAADYPVKGKVEQFVADGLSGASTTVTHTYDKPGTYFAAVRVKSNRHGDGENIFTQVKNLARARIVVE